MVKVYLGRLPADARGLGTRTLAGGGSFAFWSRGM